MNKLQHARASHYSISNGATQTTICRNLLILLVATGLVTGCERSVSLPPGVVAPTPPAQTSLTETPVFVRGGYVVRPVARFELDARVLGKERYRFGKGADISPVDLALGWGRMSDQTIIDKIKITQSRRFYWWRVKNYPIPRDEIIESSANMHMIPANDDVRSELLGLRRGELVRIEGFLVNVTNDDFAWQTSLTRKDAGSGACEIVWVERVGAL